MRTASIWRCDERLCDTVLADNYFLRLRGLMGRDVRQVESLQLKPCAQIHTCFMGYPIDVVYLDRGGQVLQIERAAQPWKFFKTVRGAHSVIELPEGMASQYQINEGDTLEVRP